MLPDRYRQLLTACVDGELTARQRRHVVRLLRRSREARHLFRKLQADALALRKVGATPPPLEVDLSAPILRTIAGRRPSPTRPPALPSRAAVRFPAWSGFVAAAGILLLIGLGSFFFFDSEEPEGGNLAKGPSAPGRQHHHAQANESKDKGPNAPDNVKKGPPHEVAKGGPKPAPPDELPPEEVDMPPGPGDPVVRVIPRPVEGRMPAPPPMPPEPKGPRDILASGQTDMRGKFEQVDLVLPNVFAVHGLEDAGNRQKLREELARGGAFRAELLCRDSARAFERLRPAFQARKIGLVIEPLAQARLKPPPKGAVLRTDFAIFVEDITAEELADLLRQAGTEDRKAAIRRSGDRRFEGGLIVAPLARLDYKDLTNLFGTNPVRVRPVPLPGPLGTDLRRPFSEQTGTAVANALDKGTQADPRSALVVTYAPVRPRHGSSEIKRFLESRKPARPGTLQVLLVLRGV